MKKARMRLLLELESIVGRECYNGNIQNWGAHGTFLGEGREFRYPVTFLDSQGRKDKRWHTDSSMAPEIAITGYYAFGANQLSIIRALDKVLAYLEREHGLELEGKRPKRADG
jgi:hypothetical protein